MKKRKKSSNKVNLIICAAAFVFLIVYVCFVDGFDKIVENIKKMSICYLLLAVLFMILYWCFEALALHAPIKKLHPQQKFYQTFIVTVLGQYFNCITPSSTGGQPMQVYYFNKLGTPVAPAMTGLLGRFIVYQFALTIYSLVVLILRFKQFATDFAPLMALVLVGFVINTIVIILLLMVAFFKKPVTKLALFILKLLKKMKIIVKTEEQFEEKKELILQVINDYHENFKLIRSQPFLIIRMLIYSTVQLTVYFSISYLIYLGFGLSGADLFTVIACQAFVQLISGFIPLPGALGAAEGSYTAFFGGIFMGSVGASTFIWRLMTFYLPIILGLICSLFLGKVMKIAVPDDDQIQEISGRKNKNQPLGEVSSEFSE